MQKVKSAHIQLVRVRNALAPPTNLQAQQTDEAEMAVHVEIPYQESLEKLKGGEWTHAAHAMIYAKWPGALFGKYEHKYAVMMQVRFDGTLGFAGGMVDTGETPEEAVSREVAEEVGCAPGLINFTTDDHVITHYSDHTHFCLHFFAKEVSLDQFTQLEAKTPQATHWGIEVLGVTRCPLYTLPNGLGLPGFLRHEFIGNSQQQLLATLARRELLSQQEIDQALKISQQVSGLVRTEDVDY